MPPTSRPLPALAVAFAAALAIAAPAGAAEPPLVRPDDVVIVRHERSFIVDLEMNTAVSQETAWAVLTDFAHMPEFAPDMDSSKVSVTGPHQLLVEQRGTAHFGPFSLHYESVREIELVPPQEIHARQISGTAQAMESWMRLRREGERTRLDYHAEIVPNALLRFAGPQLVQRELANQFTHLLAEMQRRVDAEMAAGVAAGGLRRPAPP